MANELHGENLKRFILAGNALFTVENCETGGRYTYRVVAPKKNPAIRFVQLLTGQNNDSDYSFVGTIFEDGQFRPGRKSTVPATAPSVRGFDWLLRRVTASVDLPEKVRVQHAGRCGRCGRTLTVGGSIDMGYGPECMSQMGMV